MRFQPFVVIFLLLAASGFVAAQETKPKNTKPKPAVETEEDVPTFTSDDLERKFGKSVPATPKKNKPTGAGAKDKAKNGKPAQGDALGRLQADQAAFKLKNQQRAEAHKRIAAAQARVAELEKSMAALRNPLLGRAQPGNADKEAWKNADQGARLRMTEESLATARQELAQANAALKELR